MTKRKQRFSIRKEPISSTLNQHWIDYPTPSNLSFLWGFGSLAGICLVIQIVTGVFLAIHHTPHKGPRTVHLLFLILSYLLFIIIYTMVSGDVAHAMWEGGEGSSGLPLPFPDSPVPSISSPGDSWIDTCYGGNCDEASSIAPSVEPAAAGKGDPEVASSSRPKVYAPTHIKLDKSAVKKFDPQNLNKLDSFLESMEMREQTNTLLRHHYDTYSTINVPRGGRSLYESFEDYLQYTLGVEIDLFYASHVSANINRYRWRVIVNKIIQPGSPPMDYIRLMFKLDSSDKEFLDAFLETIKELLPKRR